MNLMNLYKKQSTSQNINDSNHITNDLTYKHKAMLHYTDIESNISKTIIVQYNNLIDLNDKIYELNATKNKSRVTKVITEYENYEALDI